MQKLKTAIEDAKQCGVVVVCSAGNDGTDTLCYPAAFDGVIGVGAVNTKNQLTSYTNESSAVDIVAPSSEDGIGGIYTTVPTTINGNGYKTSGMTSCAAPQVTAAVAMMMAINGNLDADQILTRLKSRATKETKGLLDSSKTYKILNTGRAVSLTKYN